MGVVELEDLAHLVASPRSAGSDFANHLLVPSADDLGDLSILGVSREIDL